MPRSAKVKRTGFSLHSAVAVVTLDKKGVVWHQKSSDCHEAHCSGFFFGFNLDDNIYVVSDRTQIGFHAEIRAFESPAGGKTSRVNLVERVLTDFVYDNVERNRLVTPCRVSFPVIVPV